MNGTFDHAKTQRTLGLFATVMVLSTLLLAVYKAFKVNKSDEATESK